MATDIDIVEFIVGQIKEAGIVRYRKMFGEYALYVDEKVVGLICDNQLFVKPTEAGKAFIGKVENTPPYPGAKDYFLITDQLDDEEWMTELVRITATHIPLSKRKKKY